MPSETRRRAAGAEGVGDSGVKDPHDTVPHDEKKPKPERTAEETQKILNPEILEFALPKRGEGFKLLVPTVFTIGDIVQRGVVADWDAYCRLVIVELGKISSFDLRSNPALIFSDTNAPYLGIALTTSTVLEFMRRVLSKCAYVENAEGKRLPAVDLDFDELSTLQIVKIGGTLIGRWVADILAKNRPRVESAPT